MTHSLCRSRADAILGGVCGGLGEYFGVSSDFVRLLFIVLAAAGGAGLLVYFALWLFLPEEGHEDVDLSLRLQRNTEEIARKASDFSSDTRRSTGSGASLSAPAIATLLIVFGIVFLLRNLGVTWLRWVGLGTLWPVFPILVGMIFLWRSLKGGHSK